MRRSVSHGYCMLDNPLSEIANPGSPPILTINKLYTGFNVFKGENWTQQTCAGAHVPADPAISLKRFIIDSNH